jgi:uncharacterized membrane protein
MNLLILWLSKFHRFASRHLLYPILLATFLVFLYFTGRVYLIRKVRYQFLIWNLFLAWLPYIFSLAVSGIHQVRSRWWWALLIPGTLWLVFLPNAFYIVTDFIHLTDHPSIPKWYDAGLLAITSWTGIFLAVVSLYTIQQIVKSYLGNLVSWGFSMIVIGLSGYGVYLGRFLRWNSWNLFFDPVEILSDSYYLFRNPMANKDIIGFIVMYTSLFLVTYLTFAWLLPSRRFSGNK